MDQFVVTTCCKFPGHPSARPAGSLDKAAKDVGTGLVGAPACGDVMKLQVRRGAGRQGKTICKQRSRGEGDTFTCQTHSAATAAIFTVGRSKWERTVESLMQSSKRLGVALQLRRGEGCR